MNNSNKGPMTSMAKKEAMIGDDCKVDDDDLESLPSVLMEICSTLQMRLQSKKRPKSTQPGEEDHIKPRVEIIDDVKMPKNQGNGFHGDANIKEEHKKTSTFHGEISQEQRRLLFKNLADAQVIPQEEQRNCSKSSIPSDRDPEQECKTYVENSKAQSDTYTFEEALDIQERQTNFNENVSNMVSKYQQDNYNLFEGKNQVLSETSLKNTSCNNDINHPPEKEFENINIKCDVCKNWYNIEWKPGPGGQPLIRNGKSLKFCSPCYHGMQHSTATLQRQSCTGKQPLDSREQMTFMRKLSCQRKEILKSCTSNSWKELDERLKKAKFPYTCNVCKKVFFTTDNFKLHVYSHLMEDKLQKLHALRLSRALQTSGPKEAQTPDSHPFDCKICKKSFLKKSNLDSHYQTHGIQGMLRCSECNEVSLAAGSHLPVLNKESLFVCSICINKYKIQRKPLNPISACEGGFQSIPFPDKKHQASEQAHQKKNFLPNDQEEQVKV